MAILKCKMCGGELSFTEGATVCECEYCGSKQTLPKQDDEKKLKLFDRANRLRFNCEFDKAGQVYESIISEFPEEAEAYWGNLLCKYGIEYVDDPSGDKVPTCHRSSFDSFMQEDDFEQVMENSDTLARAVYRQQAKQIEEIRKGIIEVSGKEQPYDIFICYKETAESGERTLDSVLAQDVYEALTEKGYRVFFSRITLEDKLGTEYEPYIFAALNSAKIMLAFGTSYDYYNAVWVKNEWSRYLKLMAKDKTKYLIPCYKDIDAYDMPKEFARLQAQDMGKVGAVQDLLRGIEKLLGKKEDSAAKAEAAASVSQAAVGTVASYIKRVEMFLEDGDWKSADAYCEKILDSDPENGEAYLGKLMASMRIRKRESLKDCAEPFDTDKNYTKAIRYGSPALKVELESDIAFINNRKAEAARKAEEERIAKIEYTVECMAATLRQEETQSPEEQLKKNREKLKELQSLQSKLPGLLTQKKESESSISAAKDEIKKLKTRRDSFGLFAGKEKHNIDTRIAELEGSIASSKQRKEQLEKQMQGYCTGKQVDEAITVLSGAITKAENQIKSGKKIAVKLTPMEFAQAYDNKEIKLLFETKYSSLSAPAATYAASWDVGNLVSFGTYPQTKAGTDRTPIEWLVLDRDGSKALIISRYALDCKPYNTDFVDITWEKCTLRT